MQPVIAPGITYVEDFSRYLLETRGSTKASRYGSVAWVDMNSTSNEYLYTVFANYTGLHAAPIFSNLVRACWALECGQGMTSAADHVMCVCLLLYGCWVVVRRTRRSSGSTTRA